MTRRLCWLLLPLAALWADWASKAWVLARLKTEGTLEIIPGVFNLILNFNKGAIFGSLHNAPAWLRTVIFVVAGVGALGYFGYEFLRDQTPRLQRIALGLILGGALGNGLDRLRHGQVVDFLDVIIRGWHYWTFNFADSFIVCGAILYGMSLICFGKENNARRGTQS